MLVSHVLDEKRVQKDVQNAGFLLTNKQGGFLNFGVPTKYRGLFFRLHGEVIKVLDDLRIPGEITELRNVFWGIIRSRKEAHELFFMPFSTDSMVYELNSEQDIEIFFDVKKAYDQRAWGRYYQVWNEGNSAIIEFIKKTDAREDSSDGVEEYRVYLCIQHQGKAEFLNQWEEQQYAFDEQRKSPPFSRHVFKGLKIKSQRLIIAAAEQKDDAVKMCGAIASHYSKYKALQKQYAKVSLKDIPNTKINVAAKCALEALDNLIVHEDGRAFMYAGLPWFFQYWSRDTFIALKALIIDKALRATATTR